MAIVRVNKNKNYTVMSNTHFMEKQMSLKAKGLLSLMLSLPDNWDYSISGLVSINKENETSIKNALNELKDFGYLVVTKKLPNETETGRIEYVYDIYEQPYQKQGVEKQGVENLCLENQVQLNTNNKYTNNIITNDKNNIKEKNTKKENEYEAEFESIWQRYPKKVGKSKSLKSYIKARQKGATYDEVILGLENYLKQIEIFETKKQFIKDGSTWFNNECWKDEYQTTKELDNDGFFVNLQKIINETE